jgi:hypothetical protein
LEYLRANGLRFHALRELLHDFEVDVRFQLSHPDFLQGFFDVHFRDPAFTPKVLEDAL